MKRLYLSVLFAALCFSGFAQKIKKRAPLPVIQEDNSIDKRDLKFLSALEDTLVLFSNAFTQDSLLDNRKRACYAFIPKFAKALSVDNSFYYPFDSLTTVSKIYSPDSLFRIFTWQLVLPGGNFRYYGVIQMKSKKLKMYPLFDGSDTMSYHSQRILGKENWYGALYYNIIRTMSGSKSIYTLFGFEAADYLTRRKVVDILTFDDKGDPKFGAPLFHMNIGEDTMHYSRKDTFTRFFIEYKYTAATTLNYDKSMQMIVFDHVAPPTENATGATFTYVPDGTYEGFKWANDRWNWVEVVFTFSINEMDNPPIPAPLFGTPARQPTLSK